MTTLNWKFRLSHLARPPERVNFFRPNELIIINKNKELARSMFRRSGGLACALFYRLNWPEMARMIHSEQKRSRTASGYHPKFGQCSVAKRLPSASTSLPVSPPSSKLIWKWQQRALSRRPYCAVQYAHAQRRCSNEMPFRGHRAGRLSDRPDAGLYQMNLRNPQCLLIKISKIL